MEYNILVNRIFYIPQDIGTKQLSAYNWAVLVKYGDRFRELRERADLSQGDVAEKLGLEKGRGSSVSNIERYVSPPARRSTLTKHAAALGCEPWELLAGVATHFDRLRAPTPLPDEELNALLWGLAFVRPDDRRTVMEGMQSFLDALRPGVLPPPALQFALGKSETAGRTERRKKRA